MNSSVVAWLVTCLGISTVLSHYLSLGQSSLITGIHFSHGRKVCMLGGGKCEIQDGTKLRHIRPHNGLQGFTCFDVVGRVSAVLMG